MNSKTNSGLKTCDIFKNHEKEMKRQYLNRVWQLENGTFTPLVTNVGIGKECQDFIRNFAMKLSDKEGEKYSTVFGWMRTKLSFEILRSVLLCVLGSRKPFKRDDLEDVYDFEVNSVEVRLTE